MFVFQTYVAYFVCIEYRVNAIRGCFVKVNLSSGTTGSHWGLLFTHTTRLLCPQVQTRTWYHRVLGFDDNKTISTLAIRVQLNCIFLTCIARCTDWGRICHPRSTPVGRCSCTSIDLPGNRAVCSRECLVNTETDISDLNSLDKAASCNSSCISVFANSEKKFRFCLCAPLLTHLREHCLVLPSDCFIRSYPVQLNEEPTQTAWPVQIQTEMARHSTSPSYRSFLKWSDSRCFLVLGPS